MRNIVITGGAGFVGTNLIAHLTGVGIPAGRIRIFDNLSASDLSGVSAVGLRTEKDASWSDAPDAVSFVKGDILHVDEVVTGFAGADIVVHLAASTGVDISVRDPFFDAKSNVFGILNCLEGSRRCGVGRFVFSSSNAPLGLADAPVSETRVPRPLSPYGASKLAGEGYCSAYSATFGVETVVLRFSNVYGPHSYRKSSVIAAFIKNALADSEVTVFGDGENTRDMIYAEDLAKVITRATQAEGVGGEVFHVGTGVETSVNKLVEIVQEAFRGRGLQPFTVSYAPSRQGDMRRNYSDIAKVRRMLDWQPCTTLQEGVAQTLDWFLARKS